VTAKATSTQLVTFISKNSAEGMQYEIADTKLHMRIQVSTPGLMVMFDRTKVTHRKAVLIVAEIARILGHDIRNIGLIRCLGLDHCTFISIRIKEEFRADVPFVIHCNLTGMETVDRRRSFRMRCISTDKGDQVSC